MIRRLLIANRGEIAVRVAETCRRLGIESVAVFSEADREALHVRRADRAVCIGPAPAAQSYLDFDRVLDAAKRSGADAVHPGYGFLSENAAFAERCVAEGLVWVGPHPVAMERMASKVEARRLAAELGVPVVPGRESAPDGDWLAAAREVGFPVMIKASAGGGGRGIRIVEEESEFEAARTLAETEAVAAFGDGRLIVERYVRAPRHIEVQVLGDRHGNVVHLFERECSIQRRHQKVVEEAPAPHLGDEQRASLYGNALTLARAIDYDSTGTVEFLVDAESGDIYFLEMNTRLQVEHPVTELVTGLDLVALQIRSAEGERIPFAQDDVEKRGWAIEARLNAEDPQRDFAPQTGTILAYGEPGAGLRVDSGVGPASVVSPHYDALLAKVIAHGKDRADARARLIRGLAAFQLVGVKTNLAFLERLAGHADFAEGGCTTRFLEQHGETLSAPREELPLTALAAVALTLGAEREVPGYRSPWESLGGWRLLEHAGHRPEISWFLSEREEVVPVTVRGQFEVETPEGVQDIAARWLAPGTLEIECDGSIERAQVELVGDRVAVAFRGVRREFGVVPRERIWAATHGPGGGDAREIAAPFPGLVNELRVAPGDAVEEGDVVVVIEAMKMMHNLCATGAATVEEIRCRPGDSVEGGQVLVTFAES